MQKKRIALAMCQEKPVRKDCGKTTCTKSDSYIPPADRPR